MSFHNYLLNPHVSLNVAYVLTHSLPMYPFSNPWKHQKTARFSDIFRGERKGALGTNGLISINILGNFLYLPYLCPYQGLGLFMSDLLFFFIFIFIIINHITSLKQTNLFFVHFSEYILSFLDDNEDKESEWFSNSEGSASGCVD